MTGDTDIIVEVRRYWDMRAATFEGHTPTTGAARDWLAVYKHSQETMLPDHAGPMDILDVGVGTGYTAVLLAEAGHHVTGVDISARMLARADREAATRGVHIRLINGAAHPLPTLVHPVDMVTCRNLLWTLPDPAAALAGWRSALRPGGVVLLSDAMWNADLEAMQPPGSPGLSGIYRRFLESYLPLRDRLPYYRGLTADDAQHLLRSTGYRDHQRFDAVLQANPNYDPPPGFFVMGARYPGGSVPS